MKNILLIEDDAWLAESYANILRRAGYSLIVTHYPADAIRRIDATPPDVIVADILLDENTIIPLLQELQTYDDTRRIPVILCTGIEHPSLVAGKLHAYGVVGVLHKTTLTPEGLLLSVAEVCA